MSAYRDEQGTAHRHDGIVARGGKFRVTCTCGWKSEPYKFRSVAAQADPWTWQHYVTLAGIDVHNLNGTR